MSKPVLHSHSMAMSMPENASSQTYLHIASHAIKHGNKAEADDALNHAETRLLTRAVPAGGMTADSSPAVTSIENARHALAQNDMKTASQDVHMAMQQSASDDSSAPTTASYSGGMSNGMGNGGMSNNSGHMPTANFEKNSSESGGMGNPASTSDSAAVGGVNGLHPQGATVAPSAP